MSAAFAVTMRVDIDGRVTIETIDCPGGCPYTVASTESQGEPLKLGDIPVRCYRLDRDQAEMTLEEAAGALFAFLEQTS